jgi:hypothetical protein
MANEAVIIELLGNGGNPIRYTVANGTTIEKGTILRVEDPRTAVASANTGETFAGIAAMEKVASDGSTTVTAYQYGIFDLKMATNSTCQAGDLMVISGANLIARAQDLVSYTIGGNTIQGVQRALASGMIIGKALETGSSGEVIAVLVGAN